MIIERRGGSEQVGSQMIPVTGRLAIDERSIEERFVRASGPGGQNVNKVSTAVELRFDVRAAGLPSDIEARLMALAGTRINAEGVLLIDSRTYRTQTQNRDAARSRLVALLQQAAVTPKVRRATRPGKSARERRITAKKLRGSVKEQRSRGRAGDE